VFLALCGGLYGVGYYLWDYETDQTYLTCDWTRCESFDCKKMHSHTTHYKITKGLISGIKFFYKENVLSPETKVSSVVERFGKLNEDGLNILTSNNFNKNYASYYNIYEINRVKLTMKTNSTKFEVSIFDNEKKSNKPKYDIYKSKGNIETQPSNKENKYWSYAETCNLLDRKTFINSVEKRIKERVGKRKF